MIDIMKELREGEESFTMDNTRYGFVVLKEEEPYISYSKYVYGYCSPKGKPLSEEEMHYFITHH